MSNFSITIVGAGYSGTLLALQLLRAASAASKTENLKIYLLEKTGVFGPGVAYSTTDGDHLLNVPAARMSAFPDEPEHFLRWLTKRNPQATTATFAPRREYGKYIQELLQTEIENIKSQSCVELITDEAISFARGKNGGGTVNLKGGRALESSIVVLAVGHFPPGRSGLALGGIESSTRYTENCWHNSFVPPKNGKVLILGSGLTMVDIVLQLENRGFAGEVTAVSRRGLLPNTHKLSLPVPQPFVMDSFAFLTVRSLLHKVRQAVRTGASQGTDWRTIIDSMRPITADLWLALSPKEKQCFLRHVRPYWDVVRHRMAPEVAARLQRLREEGKFFLLAARTLKLYEAKDKVNVVLRLRGQQDEVEKSYDFVINCIGPESDYRRISSPLIQCLLREGIARPDAVNLGLDMDQNGALLDENLSPSSVFYTIGPIRKGKLWESIAVPELRVQAKMLAQHLLAMAK